MTNIERAIVYIEESLQTHLDAIELNGRLRRATRKWDAQTRATVMGLTGSVSFHRQAVKEYRFALKVLRKAQAHVCG